VFEKRALRRVVRVKREEVTGSSKYFILRSVTLFACPNIIGLVKSYEIKWAVCVSRVGEE
jgi:hypothetical protein